MKLKILYIILLVLSNSVLAQQKVFPFAGADDKTPSKSMYFSWINNAWEGSNEEQTLVNYRFFKWLYDKYGMKLDIYLFDSGNVDGSFLSWLYPIDDSAYEITIQPNNNRPHTIGQLWLNNKAFYCGAPNFKHKFPNGLHKIKSCFDTMGTRLGMWLGPDGYGITKADAEYRRKMLVDLAKDYKMALFKFDNCCSPLRDEKRGEFAKTMEDIRRYVPDLIALNHRINLDEQALKHMTTFLWGGQETYVDVLISNTKTATHARVANLDRGLPPDLRRITEDHGVCLSSCLDYWQDDLIMQAFNRNLIIAPEIYGNPWLLKDCEFSDLARIFNLHREYNDILVDGKILPEKSYGKHAVSRGDAHTRFITMVNLNWRKEVRTLTIDETIGIIDDCVYEVRQYHPTEKILGNICKGESIPIVVEPFRTSLIRIIPVEKVRNGINGIDYKVIQDKNDGYLEIDLLGQAGRNYTIELLGNYNIVSLDGKMLNKSRNIRKIEFPGKVLNGDSHRMLTDDFEKLPAPENAMQLFEAVAFQTDNNALEVRSLMRSGKSIYKEVEDARNAFFNNPLFKELGIWDKQLFDGNEETGFSHHRSRYEAINFIRPANYQWGCLRIDMGKMIKLDSLVLSGVSSDYKNIEVNVSNDLLHWENADTEEYDGKIIIRLQGEAYRYVRMERSPECVKEVTGFYNGDEVSRTNWKATNLYRLYEQQPAVCSFKTKIHLEEVAPNSFLAVPLEGEHGVEGAYVIFKIKGQYFVAKDRITSYPANAWEGAVVEKDSNYTYILPISQDLQGEDIEVIILAFDRTKLNFKPAVWISSSCPYVSKRLILEQ